MEARSQSTRSHLVAGAALLAGAVALCATAGCGSGGAATRRPTSSAPASASRGKPAPRRVNDAQDGDDSPTFPSYNRESDDDREVTLYGHRATGREAADVRDVVKRFFSLAVADDGSAVCAIMTARVAGDVLRMGRSPNPDYFRGKTCPAVMTKLLGHEHRRLAREARDVRITEVRIGEQGALALLAFSTTPERRFMIMERERGKWRLAELVDGTFP